VAEVSSVRVSVSVSVSARQERIACVRVCVLVWELT